VIKEPEVRALPFPACQIEVDPILKLIQGQASNRSAVAIGAPTSNGTMAINFFSHGKSGFPKWPPDDNQDATLASVFAPWCDLKAPMATRPFAKSRK
jgi:hypothetical protein